MTYKLYIFVLLILFGSNQYRVKDEIALNANQNGFDGKLQLLVDDSLPSNSDPMKIFKYLRAKLRVLDDKGNVLQTETFGKPNAHLYILSELPSWNALMLSHPSGSYEDSITVFVRVKDSKLDWLQAMDKVTGKVERIRVLSSPETNWCIDTSKVKTNPRILTVECRSKVIPSQNSDSDITFETIYTIFYRDNAQWIKVQREEEGSWKRSQGFPDLSKYNF